MSKKKVNPFSSISNYNQSYTDSLFNAWKNDNDSDDDVNINISGGGSNDDWETDDGTTITPTSTRKEDPYKTFLSNKNATQLIQGNNASESEPPTMSDNEMELMQKHGVKDFGTRAYNYGPVNRLFRYGLSGLFKQSNNDYYNNKLDNAESKEENILFKAAKKHGITADEGDLFEDDYAAHKKLQSQVDFAETYSPGNYGQGLGKDDKKLNYDEIIEKYGSQENFETEMQKINDEKTLEVKENLDPRLEEIAEGLPKLEDGSLDYTQAPEIFNKKKQDVKDMVNLEKHEKAMETEENPLGSIGFDLETMMKTNEDGTTKALENKKVFLTEALENAGYEPGDVSGKLEELFDIEDTHVARVDLRDRLDKMLLQSEGADTEDTSDDVYTLGARTEDDPDKKKTLFRKQGTRDTELGAMLTGINTTEQKEAILEQQNKDADAKLESSKQGYKENYDMLYESLRDANIPKDKINELLPPASSLASQEDYDEAMSVLSPYIDEKKGLFGKKRNVIDEAFLSEQTDLENTRVEEKAALDEKVKRGTAEVFYQDNVNQPGSELLKKKDGSLRGFDEFYDDEIYKDEGVKGFLQRLLPGGKTGKHSMATALDIDETGASPHYEYKDPALNVNNKNNNNVKANRGQHIKHQLLNPKVDPKQVSQSKKILNEANFNKKAGDDYKAASTTEQQMYQKYYRGQSDPISFKEWQEWKNKKHKNDEIDRFNQPRPQTNLNL